MYSLCKRDLVLFLLYYGGYVGGCDVLLLLIDLGVPRCVRRTLYGMRRTLCGVRCDFYSELYKVWGVRCGVCGM